MDSYVVLYCCCVFYYVACSTFLGCIHVLPDWCYPRGRYDDGELSEVAMTEKVKMLDKLRTIWRMNGHKGSGRHNQ